MRRAAGAFALAISLAAWSAPARADEGFWTFDAFPSQAVGAAYGFAPDAAWLDRVREATAHFGGGCSSSFVSPQGLVMTNHHCALGCLQQVSTPQHDVVTDGFVARTAEDERPCAGLELDRLDRIEDVTSAVDAALAGKTGADENASLRAETAALVKTCPSDDATRCDVVALYGGGRYDLYHSHRFRDVRLAFAPEYAIGQYGGDPDNFNLSAVRARRRVLPRVRRRRAGGDARVSAVLATRRLRRRPRVLDRRSRSDGARPDRRRARLRTALRP